MFHPERLTGRRARKYAQSIAYADPLPVIPKHLQGVIRAPAHHVKYVHKQMPNVLAGVRAAHYVAVIRNKIVMLNHEDQSGEKALAEMSGNKKWRCRCYAAVEMYGTHTKTEQQYDKKTKRMLASAETKACLPESLIALRLKCRPPAREYRTTYNADARDRFDKAKGRTTGVPHVPPKTLTEKFQQAELPRKILTRASEVLGAAVRRAAYNAGESTSNFVVTCDHESEQIRVLNKMYKATWIIPVESYTWYSRIYSQGLAVLGDWFLVCATRRPAAETQQGVIAALGDKCTTPSFQYASAYHVQHLINFHPNDAASPPEVVGALVRPAPGLDFFFPAPDHDSGEWKQGRSRWNYAYNLKTDHKLSPPYAVRGLARPKLDMYDYDNEDD